MVQVANKHSVQIVGWLDQAKIMKTFFLRQAMHVEYSISEESAVALGIAPKGEMKIFWLRITSIEKFFVLDGHSPSGLKVRCWYEVGRPHCRFEVSNLS